MFNKFNKLFGNMSKKKKEGDVICRSCGAEFDSKKVDLPVCPECNSASLEVKVVETKVVNK